LLAVCDLELADWYLEQKTVKKLASFLDDSGDFEKLQ